MRYLRAAGRPGPTATEDVLLALPCAADRVLLATKIRSTVLTSSLAVLEALGHRDAYFGALAREDHQAMRSLIVGEWVPMDLGVAHYRALDTLALAPEQARENGRRVADRVQKGYLVTMAKAVGLGITPWSILIRAQSILDRLLHRASAALYRVGPKDARLEIHGAPIAEFPYVRSGWAGMIEGGLDLVTRKTYCRDVSPAETSSVATYIVTWA
jgi:hypothetical protein